MLINDAILQRGRYRILRHITKTSNGHLYVARDNVLFYELVLCESEVSGNKFSSPESREQLINSFNQTAKSLGQVDHPSILGIRNHFVENDRFYLATQPVEGSTASDAVANGAQMSPEGVVRAAFSLLSAFQYLRSSSDAGTDFSLRPECLWLNTAQELALLYFANAGTVHDKTDSSYQSMETVWKGLDRASQNVIAHSYDDRSLDVLEQPADIRTDIYGIGASLYYLATRKKPADALERAIEILDGKPDPLTLPQQLNSAIPDNLSRFLIRSLEIRRESRFQTAAEAIESLRSVPQNVTSTPRAVETIAAKPVSHVPAPDPVFETAPPSTLEPEPQLNIAEAEPAVSVSAPVEIDDSDSILDAEELFDEKSDVPEKPVIQAESARTFSMPGLEDFELTHSMPAPRRGIFRPLPIAITAVLVIASAAWGVVSYSGAAKRVDPQAVMNAAGNQEKVIEPGPEPKPDIAVVEPDKNEPAATSEPPAEQLPETSPNASRSRPQIADTHPLKKPASPAAEKPAPKTKKRLTVDDLINDN